jgi:hypothetical protein
MPKHLTGTVYVCHVLTLVPLYVSILVWSGRELGVGILCFVLCVYISMCLAWYGSQSEAAVNSCL